MSLNFDNEMLVMTSAQFEELIHDEPAASRELILDSLETSKAMINLVQGKYGFVVINALLSTMLCSVENQVISVSELKDFLDKFFQILKKESES